MKVFVAGATGAVGRPLVARLLEAGHDVVKENGNGGR
jgi:nucleoside-diphosphate-sugar epimerase